MDLHDKHFSYIKDIEAYASSFCCPSCDACYPVYSRLKRHTCSVETVSKFVFPGGEFQAPRTVFEKLKERTGIDVDEHLRFYPFVITYDIESYLP